MSSLAAARADNFYYPKSWDPSKGSLNKFQKSHPLGQRAKKIDQGILIIRYETPFHVRCKKCNNMIGKGVRFNAEKKCVGKFHSTRIWEFTMKCHHCANKIIVKTDPENSEYIYEEGAYKILKTENATDMEFLRDKNQVEKERADKFFQLEHLKEDKEKGDNEKSRLNQIIEHQEKWKDDYDINCLLRKKFRTEKKEIIEIEKEKNQPKNFGLELKEIKPEDLENVNNAKFRTIEKSKKDVIKKREEIRTQSLFSQNKVHQSEIQNLKLKLLNLPKDTRRNLKSELKHQALIKSSNWQIF